MKFTFKVANNVPWFRNGTKLEGTGRLHTERELRFYLLIYYSCAACS